MEEAPATPKKSRKKKLPKVLARREAAELLRLADSGTRTGKRDLLILLLMYRAGLRVSEAVAITPRDIERDGVIHLYDAKGGDGTAYFTPADVLPALDAYVEQREQWVDKRLAGLGSAATPSAARALILNPDGSPVSVRYVQRLVKRLKERAGIHGIVTPHVFRHSFATELIEDGFPLHEVQRLLRHANIATTEVYLHVRDESLRGKMARRHTQEEGTT